MELRPSDLRPLPVAVALWALAAVGVALGPRAVVTSAAAVSAAALSAVVLTGSARARSLIVPHVVLLGIGVALLLVTTGQLAASKDALSDVAGSGASSELELRLLSDPAPPEDGPAWAQGSVTARVAIIRGTVRSGRDERRLPSDVAAFATGRSAASTPSGRTTGLDQARAGDVVRVRGTVSIGGGGRFRVKVSRVLDVRRGPPIIAQLRAVLRQSTSQLPTDEAALVRGMTTGDTRGLSSTAEDAMTRAGISHLIAVSGANIALVLATVLVPLLLLGVDRRARLVLAAAVAGAYVLLVGEEPSVLRAATMAAPLLLARFIGVRPAPVPALAMTASLWSVLDPQTAASVGFVLSGLSTAAILLAARPCARALTAMTRGRLSDGWALVLAVPLVAQAACTPVLILLSPEISVWAVPVNIVVAPLVGPATILGMLALVIGPFLPMAAAALAHLAAGSAHLVLEVALLADSAPLSRIAVPEGASGAAAAVLVLGLCVLVWSLRRRAWVRFAVACVLVGVLAPPLAQRLPLPIARDRGAWSIAACAVGQGDAFVARDPSRDDQGAILIDTGPDPALLRECLDRLQVRRIDLLVLTHPHADHIGGVAALTGERTPRRQWICPMPEAQSARRAPGPAEAVLRGARASSGALAVEVLWPTSPEAVEAVAARETSSSEQGTANDCSVAVAIRWPDGTRLVALGDLEPQAQRALAELDPGPADVVKVAHHGSRRQEAMLYQRLAPRLALIGVGRGNTFGHPSPPTLAMLGLLAARTVRTDEHGTVTVQFGAPARAGAGERTADELRSVGPGR